MEAHGFGRQDPNEPIDYSEGLEIELSTEEHDQLVAWETKHAPPGEDRYYTFGRVASVFRRMTSEINGDHWNIDDYAMACLRWREELQERLDSAPQPLRDKLALVVDRLDKEFLAVTDPDDHGWFQLWYRIDPSEGWWFGRIPQKGRIRKQLEERAAAK
jgi:hypothetical protein